MNLQRMRRMWLQRDGEKPLFTVYWPRDYPFGSIQQIGRHCYQITRYMRAASSRFIEVWGRSAPCRKDD